MYADSCWHMLRRLTDVLSLIESVRLVQHAAQPMRSTIIRHNNTFPTRGEK